MPSAAKPAEQQAAAVGGRTSRLRRPDVLEAALALADEQGLEALTMRRLAQELGVDPMAVHRQVGGKDGVLDGLVEALWDEVGPLPPDAGWRETLETTAKSMRTLAHAHPNVYALICTRGVMPEAALRLCEDVLEKLERAGFAREIAAEALRSVLAYSMGYALSEIGAWAPQATELDREPTEVENLVRIIQALPRGTPPHLVEVAAVVCNCDMDRQFTFGLELMLDGLGARRESAPEAEA